MTTGEDAILEKLRTDYGRDWNIWRATNRHGVPGMWVATRHRKLSPEEGKQGLDPTIPCDTPGDLRKALAKQAEIEERVSAPQGG
jgi:hypothetical protein